MSYYAVVKLVPDWDAYEVVITDETGLWTVWAEMQPELEDRLEINTDRTYFRARLRGGDVDLHERDTEEHAW